MDEPTWIPRPDPALSVPLPEGMRPHCHPLNELHGWVFLQGQVWVDYWGNEHEIELMSLDYVANVMGLCELRADHIRLMAYVEAANRAFDDATSDNDGAGAILQSFSGSLDGVSDDLVGGKTAVEWLRTTPLLRALSRRLKGSKS